MSREDQAGEALRTGPLKHTSWADAARVKRIPMVLTNTLPAAFRLRRPIAMRATDARVCRALLIVVEDLLIDIGLNNRGRQAILGFALCAHIH